MTNAITVSGANKHYGEFAALDNVDFEVPSGSGTAVIGSIFVVRRPSTLPHSRIFTLL